MLYKKLSHQWYFFSPILPHSILSEKIVVLRVKMDGRNFIPFVSVTKIDSRKKNRKETIEHIK